ncbi:hypothetical protein ACFL23_03215, partial [Patescibacteria group bacterium]
DLYFQSIEDAKSEREKKQSKIIKKGKNISKVLGGFGKGVMEAQLAFEASAATIAAATSLAGVTATAGSGVVGSLALAGGMLYGGRKMIDLAKEARRKHKYMNKEIDLADQNVNEMLKQRSADIMSIELMDKADTERQKEEDKYEKKREQYVTGKISEEKWNKFLDNRYDGMFLRFKKFFKRKKKEPATARRIGEAMAGEGEYSNQEKEDIGAATAVLGKTDEKIDGDVERQLFEIAKSNPKVFKKIEKDGTFKKIGKEYINELKGLALFQIPVLRLALAGSGGGDIGNKVVDATFEGNEWYEKNKYHLRTILKTVAITGGAVGLSLAFFGKAEAGQETGKSAKQSEGGVGEWVSNFGKAHAGEQEVGKPANQSEGGAGEWLSNKGKGVYENFKNDWGKLKDSPKQISEVFKDAVSPDKLNVGEQELIRKQSEAVIENDIHREFAEKINEIKEGYEATTFEDIGKAEMKNMLDYIDDLDGKLGELSLEDKQSFLHFSDIFERNFRKAVESKIQKHVEIENEIPEVENVKKAEKVEPVEKVEKVKKVEKVENKVEVKDDLKIKDEIVENEIVPKPEKVAKPDIAKTEITDNVDALPVEATNPDIAKIEIRDNVDTVWDVGKEVRAKHLGDIELAELPKELKGVELENFKTAQETFVNDAIKDEIVSQMKAKNKAVDIDLVKDGDVIEVDVAKIRENLADKKIIKQANELSSENVENILENNAKIEELTVKSKIQNKRVTSEMIERSLKGEPQVAPEKVVLEKPKLANQKEAVIEKVEPEIVSDVKKNLEPNTKVIKEIENRFEKTVDSMLEAKEINANEFENIKKEIDTPNERIEFMREYIEGKKIDIAEKVGVAPNSFEILDVPSHPGNNVIKMQGMREVAVVGKEGIKRIGDYNVAQRDFDGYQNKLFAEVKSATDNPKSFEWKDFLDYVREENNYVKEIGKENIKFITENGKLIPGQAEVVKNLANDGYKIDLLNPRSDMNPEAIGNCLRILGENESMSTMEKTALAKFMLKPNIQNVKNFFSHLDITTPADMSSNNVIVKKDVITVNGLKYKNNEVGKIFFDLGKGKFFKKPALFGRQVFDTLGEFGKSLKK